MNITERNREASKNTKHDEYDANRANIHAARLRYVFPIRHLFLPQNI